MAHQRVDEVQVRHQQVRVDVEQVRRQRWARVDVGLVHHQRLEPEGVRPLGLAS